MTDYNQKKLKRYKNSEYLFLIKEWQKSKGSISDEKLNELIRANNLHIRFGIKIYDVKKDIEELEILKKPNDSKSLYGSKYIYYTNKEIDYEEAKQKDEVYKKNIESERNKINIAYSRYKDWNYMGLIEKWSKRIPTPTDEKLKNLIMANKLDKQYGVTVVDVRIDIDNYDYIIDQLILQHNAKKLDDKSNKNNKQYNTKNTSNQKISDNKQKHKNDSDADKNYTKLKSFDEGDNRLDRSIKAASDALYDNIYDNYDMNSIKGTALLPIHLLTIPDGQEKCTAHRRKLEKVFLSYKVKGYHGMASFGFAPLCCKECKRLFIYEAEVDVWQKRFDEYKLEYRIISLNDSHKILLSQMKENKANNSSSFYIPDELGLSINTLNVTDLSLVEKLYKSFIDYPELLGDNKLLKNLLSDVIVENKMELNILKVLINCNILDEMKNCDILDNTLRHRYVKKLSVEYGINDYQANRILLIWFYAYGNKYLNKDIL